MGQELQLILTIGTPIAAIALSYGGIRAMVKSLQKEFIDLSQKVTALEKERATTNQVRALEDTIAANLKSIDLKIAAHEAARAQYEVTLATLKASHEELTRRHNDGFTEVRNRTSTLEGRAANIEQGAAEMRAQMNALVQTVSRVEAKQDREAASLEQIRRDILEFVVNARGRDRDHHDRG